ncbi:MAG: hypothetical protein GC203_20445 [Phenylobacterium sp.]|uniref:hypothetical protein n=1 Tax=Phenylobacterium sp. TaxID=1871053 RepID=UPI0025D2E7AA|nr:hypothetical protein [Phenylobacterium sp.]MBI1200235.1 hypothetical protein [Phenylobacterium sp.]
MLFGQRGLETLAMLMIGDGLLALASPRRHVSVWRRGPEPWRRFLDYFGERPALTAGLGLAETVAGFWLARRQTQQRQIEEQA